MISSAGLRKFLVVGLICFTPLDATAQGTDTPPFPGAPGTKTATEPILTLFTEPANATVTLKGPSSLTGVTPLDLPSTVSGRYSVVVEGGKFTRTHGIIFIPPRGSAPVLLSESPGLSPTLLLRGINYPGIPQLMSGRVGRGIALSAAETGALVMVVYTHMSYRDRLDEVGDYAGDRSKDEKAYRDSWLLYGAAVLGLSALDYWIRPRFDFSETTPARLTIDAPRVNRGGAIFRSLLVPGAGQEFGNHRTRSIVWLGGVLFSGAAFVVADYKVHRDETDLKFAQINVDNAGPSELPMRQLELEQQQRSFAASKDIRQGFAIAALSVYALNLFDAMVMPLSLPIPSTKVASVTPILSPDQPGLAVSVRF